MNSHGLHFFVDSWDDEHVGPLLDGFGDHELEDNASTFEGSKEKSAQ